MSRRSAETPWHTGLPWAACLVLAGCGQAMPTPDQFARMAQRCLDQMVSDTCRVAQGRQPVAAGGVPPTAVFVAGVGAIDARAYDELRRSGEAMCGVALQACRRDADSPACGVARQLWGGPTDSPGTQAARGASSAPR